MMAPLLDVGPWARPPKPSTMLLTLLLLLLLERGLAQFAMVGTLSNATIGASDAVLEAQLQDAPDLWQVRCSCSRASSAHER